DAGGPLVITGRRGRTRTMATTTQNSTNETIAAFQDKVKTDIQGAKAKLDEFETKAKAAGKHAAEIAGLTTAKDNISRKLQDLKTTHASNVARAKADIDAEVTSFKASLSALGEKLKTDIRK